MRKIELFKDKNCNIDLKKITEIINEHSSGLELKIGSINYSFDFKLINKPSTFNKSLKLLSSFDSKTDLKVIITEVPYANNYFYVEHNGLIILSLYGWSYLSSLPIENGLFFWLCNIAFMDIMEDYGTSHTPDIGCINDFLNIKTNITRSIIDGRICATCKKNLNKKKLSKIENGLINDIEINLSLLSNNSKFGLSILEDRNIPSISTTLKKRKPIKKGIVKILIASPSDTQKEREILLTKLEVEFRKKHEEDCGFRIIPCGWEELASQPGYPQDIINDLILPNVDIVLGIFKHKLGTPTLKKDGTIRAESGTVEELYYALEKKTEKVLCMLYVYATAPTPSLEDPNLKTIQKEWKRLKEFKNSVQKKVIYKSYQSEDEILNMALEDIKKNIKTYFMS